MRAHEFATYLSGIWAGLTPAERDVAAAEYQRMLMAEAQGHAGLAAAFASGSGAVLGGLGGGGGTAVSGGTNCYQSAQAPMPDLPKSLVAGPTIGWRFWSLYSDGQRAWIEAVVYPQTPWLPGTPMRAVCSERHHHAPEPRCSCGLYAMRAKDDVVFDYQPSSTGQCYPGGRLLSVCVGRVALWGRVIEHEKGYRAEYAYPLSIELWGHQRLPSGFPVSAAVQAALDQVRADFGIADQKGANG